MSVATEFAPTAVIPARARAYVPGWRPELPEFEPDCDPRGPGRLASVRTLHAPSTPEEARPLRLTRRGVCVLSAAVVLLGLAVGWLARLSAPAAPAQAAVAAHNLVVEPGDTLWSIASRVAPNADPRAEVARLEQRNHLQSVDLMPGQVLRVP